MASTPGPSSPVVVQYNTSAALALYTGVYGELTVNTDRNTLVIHDGITPGGVSHVASATVALSAASVDADVLAKVNEIILKLQNAGLML